MPKRKYARRKRSRKRRSRRRPRFTTMGAPAGVPTTQVISMRYADRTTITSSSGVMGTFVISANSIHDPSVSGTGHQPMGHDTMQSLYNDYIVLGSRIKVIFNEVGAVTSIPMMCGVNLQTTSTTTYLSYDSFLEAKKGRWVTVSGNKDDRSVAYNYSTKKFFNVTDVKDNQLLYGASFGFNPNVSAYFVIYAQSLDALSTESVRVTVIIDYIVSVAGPKSLDQS